MKNTMLKIKQIVALVSILAIFSSILPTNSAGAGIIDKKAKYTESETNMVLQGTTGDTDTTSKNILSLINDVVLVGNSSPIPSTSSSKNRIVKKVITVPSTAYTSRPEETDDTPFITASNTHVRWGVVAANFLPFGTELRIPDMYGDTIFVVEDRMNSRYDYKMDLWFSDLQDARQYGLRNIRVEILES